MWITREETFSDYDIYETEPFWVVRWLRWGGTPLFTVDAKLLEALRPGLKLKGGLNKEGRKEIKKFFLLEAKNKNKSNREITLEQAKALVECFGGDEDYVLTLVEGDEKFHSGKGLYAHDEYPEHGYFFLGKGGEK